jgi:hypothetical protein
MMRFAQRLTADFNVRVKTLIRTEPTSNVAITNKNSGGTPRGSVAADKRYVSPFKLLNIPATHSTARIILTSSGFLAVLLMIFIVYLLFCLILMISIELNLQKTVVAILFLGAELGW